MEIYKILNLKCNNKTNKKKLLSCVLKVLKLNEKPKKEKLRKICKKIESKYKYNIIYIIYNTDKTYTTSIKGINGYLVYDTYSEYEALLKYILFVRCFIKYENNKRKMLDVI